MRPTLLRLSVGGLVLGACLDVGSLQGGPARDAPDASSAGGDATTAGAEAGTGPAPSPCAVSHAFCADFSGATYALGWSGSELGPGADVSLSPDDAVTPPSAFLVRLPRRTAKSNAYLYKDFFVPWRRTILEVDLLLEPPQWMAGDIDAAILSVEFHSAANGYGVFFGVDSKIAYLGTTDGPALPTGTVTHVKLDVDPAGSGNASYDGKTIPTTFQLPAVGANPFVRVTVGLTGYNAPVPAMAVHYDNVVVDFL